VGVYIVITAVAVALILATAWTSTTASHVEIARAKERAAHDRLLTARIDAAVRNVDVSQIR
jgi:hypothetical protein